MSTFAARTVSPMSNVVSPVGVATVASTNVVCYDSGVVTMTSAIVVDTVTAMWYDGGSNTQSSLAVDIPPGMC